MYYFAFCRQQCRTLHQRPKQGFADWYRSVWSPKRPCPASSGDPRSHIVQLGDPVLRETAKPIRPVDIGTDAVQHIIRVMSALLRRYDALGLSAPQVGLPARIVVLQCTRRQLDAWPREVAEKYGMREFPLRVLVNPSARVLDSRQVVGREGCCSMHGYSALVPRADRVEVTALDGEGRDVRWETEGWPSRLVQHELDHLEGKMFVDRMQAESLYFNYWKTVNDRRGDFRLGFSGISGIRHRVFPFNYIKYKQD